MTSVATACAATEMPPGQSVHADAAPRADATIPGALADATPVAALELPFAVDDWFAPGGFMGDGELGGIEAEEECASPRPGQGSGRCHRFTWTPGDRGWAGVFWQYPDNNWGLTPGLAVPQGASRVTFYAWGNSGGEIVDLYAGMTEADGFHVATTPTALVTQPTKYTLELTNVVYSDVTGGFGWSAADSTTPVVFYIDDIRWE